MQMDRPLVYFPICGQWIRNPDLKNFQLFCFLFFIHSVCEPCDKDRKCSKEVECALFKGSQHVIRPPIQILLPWAERKAPKEIVCTRIYWPSPRRSTISTRKYIPYSFQEAIFKCIFCTTSQFQLNLETPSSSRPGSNTVVTGL